MLKTSLVLLCGVLLSCAATRSLTRAPAKDAETAYKNALEDLEGGLYPEALQGFADVKTKYPYSKYSALADLRGADTHYERGKFLEAIDAYRQFMKLHPNHEESSYAMYKIGEAYFEQIPEDWFFLPPSAEKDQDSTRRAIAAFRDAIERFPNGEHAQKCRDRLNDGRRKLADHEMYVANFYWKREKWQAAAGRAEGLVRDYSGLGLDAEALWVATRARHKLGQDDLARQNAMRLVNEHPATQEASDAKTLMNELKTEPNTAQPTAQAKEQEG